MRSADFSGFCIRCVSERDIKDSNAPLESVDVHTIITLDRMYEYVKRDHQAVRLLIAPDGLTTGVHNCTWHGRGLAVDLLFDSNPKHLDIYDMVKLAIESGFCGVGVYWTGAGYRMHVDMRPRFAMWGASRNGDNQCVYRSVFSDPRKFDVAGGDKQDVRPVPSTAPAP